MIKAPHRFVLLAALLLPLGCKQKTPSDKPLPLAQLETALARLEGDAARSMEMAEAIKCRRLRIRLGAAGVTTLRLPDRDRVPLPRLRPGEAVLSIFQGGGRLRRFLATPRGVRELASLRVGEVEPGMILARDQLEYGDDQGDGLWGRLQQLHRVFFGDVSGLGQQIKRLMVLPDGMARYLPLHALFVRRDADGRPSFVAQRVTVSYAPCMALASRLEQRSGGATVIVPAYGTPPRPLEGSRQEAGIIARLLPGSRTLLGPAATPVALERALTGSSKVVHFSGHGLAALEPRNSPELVFRGDQRAVTVASVGRLKVRAPLVVLSSCTTAYVARFRDGKRLMARVNLAEALLARGARQVVAASWTAKDRWTTQQMKVFYSHLQRRGPAEAMARAYRHGIGRLVPPHPRFWAPHALYGGW